MKASLIISFYNNLKNLDLIFGGLAIQSENEFEVIIADDGSSDEIVEKLKRRMAEMPFPVKHVWHEDNGWWKNRILNQAVKAAESDYLIFIDGDCIPHHHFVKDHLSEKNRQLIIGGRRANLSKEYSDLLTYDAIVNGQLKKFWNYFRFNRKMRHFEKSLRLHWGWTRKFLDTYDKGLLGCNFSVHKSKILEVNGFDERYRYPGVGEDTDLEVRLHQIGMKTKTIPFKAVQYHLFHPRLSRSGEEENLKILMENQKLQDGKTTCGITT